MSVMPGYRVQYAKISDIVYECIKIKRQMLKKILSLGETAKYIYIYCQNVTDHVRLVSLQAKQGAIRVTLKTSVLITVSYTLNNEKKE